MSVYVSMQGPCRRKLDGIIQGMKDTSRVMALSLYLPNCDRKGFFKRKQVHHDVLCRFELCTRFLSCVGLSEFQDINPEWQECDTSRKMLSFSSYL